MKMELDYKLLEEAPHIKVTPTLIFCAITTLFSSFFYGYMANVIGPAMVYISTDFQLSDMGMVVLVNSLLPGAILGSLVVSLVADKYGRKTALIIACPCY